MNALVYGACSSIARETARLFARDGAGFFLVARDEYRLSEVAAQLRREGARRVDVCAADANDVGRHAEILKRADESLGGLDLVLVAHGILPESTASERDPAIQELTIRTNLTSVASLCTHAAELFERRRAGTIAVLSSVAGERGRRRNYVYAATKAGLNAYLQGLRARLQSSGVHVLTVKPGYVDTPMTAPMKKRHGRLFARPEDVARGIRKAILSRRDEVYLPGWWRPLMFAMRAIPERFFKKMDV